MELKQFVFSYLDLGLDALYQVLNKQYANENKYILKRDSFYIDQPIKQNIGGKHFPKAVFFIPKCCQDKTIMISNYSDGWITLGNKISNESSSFHYNFRLSKGENENLINSFTFWNNGKNQRVVYTIKDPKWLFYEQGNPLWFENVENYKKRLIRDRLNFEILVSYCEKIGIYILNKNFFASEDNAIYLEQINW